LLLGPHGQAYSLRGDYPSAALDYLGFVLSPSQLDAMMNGILSAYASLAQLDTEVGMITDADSDALKVLGLTGAAAKGLLTISKTAGHAGPEGGALATAFLGGLPLGTLIDMAFTWATGHTIDRYIYDFMNTPQTWYIPSEGLTLLDKI
jgi:hypothetical protein